MPKKTKHWPTAPSIDFGEITWSDYPVLAHRQNVIRVMTNLLENASDAVSNLPVRWVKITTRLIGAMLEIRVSDSGSGVPKEVANQIFVPFFSTKDAGHGSGLGLSICQELVEADAGQIALDTTASNTTFVISLPTKVADDRKMTA